MGRSLNSRGACSAVVSEPFGSSARSAALQFAICWSTLPPSADQLIGSRCDMARQARLMLVSLPGRTKPTSKSGLPV